MKLSCARAVASGQPCGEVCGIRTRVRTAFVAIEAGRRDQLGVVPSRAHEVDQREGDVRVVAPEHPGRRPAGRRDRLGLDPFRAEVPEHLQLAFVLDLKGRLVTRRQDAADRPRVVADGTVRKREVGFFEESLSVHREQEVLVPDPALSLEDVSELRADDGPDLRPDDRCGLPERGGVLGAQNRDVAVVVKVEEVRPPEQRHREPVLEHHRRRGPQADWPLFERAQRRPAPVEPRDPRGHLPAQRQHVAHVDAIRAAPPGMRGPPLTLVLPRWRYGMAHFGSPANLAPN